MTTFKRSAICTLIVLIVMAAGCSKTIPVGVLISNTGAGATYGEKVHKGIELAVEEVNEAGGFQGKSFELSFPAAYRITGIVIPAPGAMLLLAPLGLRSRRRRR